jgi:hypothetical protein
MEEIYAVVEDGQIKLPAGLRLPDGLRVKIVWDTTEAVLAPYDREMLTEEDIQADLEWAKTNWFRR